MTIKEIAKLAGVSPAAVSRYFNGGSLGETKREAIQKIIEKTGYRPNPAAHAVRTGRGGQVAVIIPTVNNDSVSEIMDGIARVLNEHGISMYLVVTDQDRDKEAGCLEMAQQDMAAGAILMSSGMGKGLKKALEERKIPVVVTGQCYEGVSCVCHDDTGAMKAAAELMVECGRKRIAFIGADENDGSAGAGRKKGVEEALEGAGMKLQKKYYRISDFSVEGGKRAMEELLKEKPLPDAVLCASDYTAFGAAKAVREAGLKIPEDIALSGIGDNWACTVTEPALTTVRLNYRECGQRAAELLLSEMNGNAAGEPEHIMLGYSLIERGTV